MVDFLKAVPLLKHMDEDRLQEIARRARVKEYKEKEVIIKQGENSDKFFIIKEGLVGIILEVDKKNEEVMGNLKGKGEFFGEIGIIYNIPRSATVIALAPTTVLILSDSDFMELIFGDEEARKLLQELAETRLVQNEETLERYKKTILDVIYRYNI